MNADAIQASTQNNLDLAQRSLEQMETVAATMRSTNAHIEHFSSTVTELHTSSMKINARACAPNMWVSCSSPSSCSTASMLWKTSCCR